MDNFNQPFKPNNHMVMAIITTVLSLLSCTILGAVPGIVSIVFASQVNSKYANGDFDGAEQASKNAKIWWIVGLVVFLLALILMIAFGGYIFAELMNNPEFKEAIEEAKRQQQ